jgi:hypothetical protein|tara:strand:- start:500 stop:1078 length:579 start_codon:yes stop_codon:yes gene_type:complete
MSSSATPYGARPVGTLSASGSFSGKVRHYSIASGYATSIFYGDFVKLVAAGGVEKDTGTTACTPVGIFLGVSYTDPNTSQKTFSQMWTASVVASDATAYVIDDPDVLFEMQADGTAAQTVIGNNAAVALTAGSTSIGTSKNVVDISTIAVTATLPIRIVDISSKSGNAAGDSYTDLVVKFNAGHIMRNTTGI